MSKSFKQLKKYYYESIQSAENYGFNYKADKDFIRFDAEIKKGQQKFNKNVANNAYDAFIARKNDFVQKIKTEEQRLKRQGQWVAKKPTTEKEEKAEEKEGMEIYDERDQRANNSMHIKDLLKRNPTLKNDLRRILKKDLLKGDIGEEEYNDLVKETKINYDEFAKIPELRNQPLQVAQKEYLKGNIDETEYHRVKAIATQPVAERSNKVPFIDIVNYKPTKRIIN